jgi:stage III sporulation protein SpoIIIAA
MSSSVASLLALIPPAIRASVLDESTLIEIVLDLGRAPEIRYLDHTVVLTDQLVTHADLAFVTDHLVGFGDDDRAGVDGELHRISRITRRGKVVGLTCRAGRHIPGAAEKFRDLLEEGKSILFLGRPGAGKSTALRSAAFLLSTDLEKRVVVVDTSNELAGDGDIPHHAIGRARRMPVEHVAEQAIVMQRAVENHTPEVIIIDEIGNEAEALAARTIAERGVQLIATAHGNTLADLMQNVALVDLLGGLGSVTLGDAEARRRGTQKTAIERKLPPTFPVIVEIIDHDNFVVYRDVADAVDKRLRGLTPDSEARAVTAAGVARRHVAGDPEPVAALQAATFYIYGLDAGDVQSVLREFGGNFRLVRTPKEATHLLVRSKLIDRVDFDLGAHAARGLVVVPVQSSHRTHLLTVLKRAGLRSLLSV